MNDLASLLAPLFTPEPWGPRTAGLMLALLIARGLDFLSTWLVTPRLELEANPLMRRTGFARMALLNLPLLGLPWLHHGLSITFIVTSLLTAGANLTGGALARGMGEKRQVESQIAALKRIGLAGALALNTAGGAVTMLGGGFLMLLASQAEAGFVPLANTAFMPMAKSAWWGGLGVVMFGLAGMVHLNAAIVRLHRRGR